MKHTKQKCIRNKDLFTDNSKINLNSSDDLFADCDILDNHFETSVGVQESTDKIAKNQHSKSKNKNVKVGDGVFVLNEKEIKTLGFNDEEIALFKPYVNTSHISRYNINFQNEYLLYSGKTEREKIAKGIYPNIKKHLNSLKEFITFIKCSLRNS
ncbi:MAG TPA: hypothetical protein DCO83_16520 [Mucilaginibacter sp.]|nr:hypothetical protein [Mucilaginibacter sp.]